MLDRAVTMANVPPRSASGSSRKWPLLGELRENRGMLGRRLWFSGKLFLWRPPRGRPSVQSPGQGIWFVTPARNVTLIPRGGVFVDGTTTLHVPCHSAFGRTT